ncbi:hypothetical protein N7486_011105 [Penicillium sp. IBT 16267x]|nr:hypothetical protein N7486_011105 [Penicillium sp. IBT 16267x]
MDRRSIFCVSLIGSCAVSRAQARFAKTNCLHPDLLPVASSRDQRIRSGIHTFLRAQNHLRASQCAQEPEGCNKPHGMAYNSAKKTPIQAL